MKSEFFRYCEQGYTHVPLVRQTFADFDTALSCYLKLADQPYSYLFESVQGGEQWGRYSIIGLPCRERIVVRDAQLVRYLDDMSVETVSTTDPLGWIEAFQSQFKVPESDHLPRFSGGLVGCFGYDTIQYIEPKVRQAYKRQGKALGSDEMVLLVSEEVAVFDNLSGKLSLIVHAKPDQYEHHQAAYDQAQQRLDQLEALLRKPLNIHALSDQPSHRITEADFVPNLDDAEYAEIVERAKSYIYAGDVMQVVPSRRFSVDFPVEPINLYRSLRSLNPSPYMYFVNLNDRHIVGSSPEILVRLEAETITLRPIAGTRRRGHSVEEDEALKQELLTDPKEIAEHVMLIDLGRNDVGRVSEVGQVELTERMTVEKYSHVMHIVSNVVGKLKSGLTAFDVLKATFPAGTISGSPKVRAMEIIAELEPSPRGFYSGAIGYIGWNGNMDTAIAIRTAVIQQGRLHVQAGGGIVYDSIAKLENKETRNKARAMFRAAELAANNLKEAGDD